MVPKMTNGTWHDATIVGFYSLIFCLGLPLNLIALCIFFCGARIRSLTTVYMKNLAASDLLLVFSLPIRIYHFSTNHILPPLLCELTGMVLLVNMYASIFLLTCISWDRCMAICFPMNSQVRTLRKRAKYICLGVWVLTIGASIPAYIIGKAQNPNKTESCLDNRPVYATQYGTVTSALIVGFAVPLAIMSVCSWALMRAIQKSVAAQMELVSSHKIQSMIVTNLSIFLLCFLPYHSVLLLYLFWEESRILDFAYKFTMLAACSNTVLDPLAYYFVTETFQKIVVIDNLRKVFIANSDNAPAKTVPKVP